MTEEAPHFRVSTVKTLLDMSLAEQSKGNKVKLGSTKTADLVAEYLRCVVVEATERAASVAGDSRSINESHLEQILPQLLLDIS